MYESLGIRFETTGVNSTLADVKRVDNELGRVTNTAKKSLGPMQNLSTKFSGWGRSLTGFGMALAPLTAVIGGIGFAGLRTASQFEDAMAEISARTGIVGDDLKRIEDFALQMGAQTVYSANEAAAGFLQLLASGQTAEQAIATLPTVLDLAAASGEDLGFTADALTDIMAAFNLGVGDSIYVADALARAAGASSADVASLAAGFGNVGPVARQFGIDVDTTAAILAVLSENGIKAAEGGTALRSMLLNMTRPTEAVQDAWKELGTSFYNADGSARPITDVLADIKIGLKDLPLEDQNRLLKDLAGNYGIVALQALLGEMSIEDMEAAMEGQASAAEVAAKRMNTFSGRVEGLKGSIETLMIKAMRPFMDDVLKPIVTYATEVVNKLAEWAEKNPELTSTILTLGAALVALVAVSLTLGGILSGLGALIGLLASPVLLALAAFAGLGAYLGLFGDDIKNKTREWVDKFVEWVPGAVESLRTELGKIINTVTAWITEQAPKIKARLLTWADTFLGWVVIAIPLVRGQLNSLINTITTWITEQAPKIKTRLLTWADTFLGWAVPVVTTISSQLSKIIDKVTGWISEQAPKLGAKLLGWTAEFTTWAKDNVAQPIADELSKINWETQLETVGNVLQEILDALGSAAVDFGRWVRTNIVYPIADKIRTINWSDALSTVGNILQKILDAIGSVTIDFKSWVNRNIIYPIAEKLMLSDADWLTLLAVTSNVLQKITDGIAGGIVDFFQWAYDNVAQPIATEISKLSTWTRVGELLFQGAKYAIAGMAFLTSLTIKWAADNIATPIAKALNIAVNDPAAATQYFQAGWDIAESVGAGMQGAVKGIAFGFATELGKELLRLGIIGPGNAGEGGGAQATPVPGQQGGEEGGGRSIWDKLKGAVDIATSPFPLHQQWGGKYGLSPFLAGEKGPELIFPRSGGFVASNHMLRNLANNMMNPVLSGNTNSRTLNYQPVFNTVSEEGAYYANQNMINMLTLARQF